MNSFILKSQQWHPCTVPTPDGICWPVSCFAHDLSWQACQLIHAGVDSKHQWVLRDLIPRDPEVRSLFTGVNACLRELPWSPFPSPHNESFNPWRDHSLHCTLLDNKTKNTSESTVKPQPFHNPMQLCSGQNHKKDDSLPLIPSQMPWFCCFVV